MNISISKITPSICLLIYRKDSRLLQNKKICRAYNSRYPNVHAYRPAHYYIYECKSVVLQKHLALKNKFTLS